MKNIAIKNDNVGKKSLTLSGNYNVFNKIIKNLKLKHKNLFKRKPLEKILGVCLHSERVRITLFSYKKLLKKIDISIYFNVKLSFIKSVLYKNNISLLLKSI